MTVYHSIADVPAGHWDHQIPNERYALQSSYLRAMELANNPQMEFRYVTVHQEGQLIAQLAFHLLTVHKTGLNESINDPSAPAWKQRVGKLVKKGINSMKIRLLVLGNTFVTGMYGFHAQNGDDKKEAIQAIAAACSKIRRESNAHIVMIKDFAPEWEADANKLEKSLGYKLVRSQPTMEIGIKWKDYPEYLQSLQSKYRVRAKKIDKISKPFEIIPFGLKELAERKKEMHQIYLELIGRAEFNMAIAGENFFYSMKEQMGDRYLCYGYFLEGKFLGYLTGFLTDDVLESHYIGFDPSYNRSHGFYQRILHDFLILGIRNEVKRVTYGRTALEIKSTIGAAPYEMNTYMWCRNPILHRLTPRLFDTFRDDAWIQRKPFKGNK